MRLLATFAGPGASSAPRAQPIEPLAARQEEVLLTVARRLTNAEIADELHISLSTSKSHFASLLGKLGVPNRSRSRCGSVRAAAWCSEAVAAQPSGAKRAVKKRSDGGS